jgi:simple sugar transport system substrate-binding protein
MKRLFLFLIVIFFGFLNVALAQKDRADIRIVVVTHGAASDPYWSVVKNGVNQAQKDLGVQVEYRSPETFDMPAMAQLINAAVASKPDGLIVSIPDASALGEGIKAAIAAGIPVMSIDSGAAVYKDLGVLRHFGQVEYEAGLAGGKRFAAEGGKKGLCVNHEQGNVDLDMRCQGFAEGLGSEVKVLAVSTDPTEVKNAVASALQADPSIDTILAVGPVSAEPALEALRAAGQIGKIRLGTFDMSPTVLQALIDKEMSFAIDAQQYLQGYLSVEAMTLYIQYGLLPGNEIIMTGPGFVTPDTAEQVIGLSAQGVR